MGPGKLEWPGEQAGRGDCKDRTRANLRRIGARHSRIQRPPRQLPYVALEFVVPGKGALTLNNRRFELAPGTLYAYSPGVSRRIDTAGSSEVMGISPGKFAET